MHLQQALSDLLIALLNLAVAALSFYGVRALNAWSQDHRYKQLRQVTLEVVKWAAQKMQDSLGKEKYEAASTRISSRLPWVKKEELEEAIEAAIHDLNAGIQELS